MACSFSRLVPNQADLERHWSAIAKVFKMKCLLVFALLLVTAYCFPRGKFSPKHGIKDPHRKKTQPTRSTITTSSYIPETTAQTSQGSSAILDTTVEATMNTVASFFTLDNNDFTRGDQ
ncbi:unnamed protein product [Ranitomeya imitator]|uniref:Uncharacterized protein n=1 Tax=Ranitomeya imitator TaxID=111125 RepID=A0ABN9LHP1_9NEOB|nr:unnamed protein product [Ranitomeya imitator]